ncbi:MAG: hypothetical protein J7J75_00985 [Euryarchaeota archaeon]|nr:hypothetical protein [Euryarchaeota archaeon]MCD6158200.1 hypothetical protein [Euryarchaeota archaeon]
MIGLLLTALMRTLQVLLAMLALFMFVISLASYVKLRRSLLLLLAFSFLFIAIKPILDAVVGNYGVIALIHAHIATTLIALLLLVISYVSRIRYLRGD